MILCRLGPRRLSPSRVVWQVRQTLLKASWPSSPPAAPPPACRAADGSAATSQSAVSRVVVLGAIGPPTPATVHLLTHLRWAPFRRSLGGHASFARSCEQAPRPNQSYLGAGRVIHLCIYQASTAACSASASCRWSLLDRTGARPRPGASTHPSNRALETRGSICLASSYLGACHSFTVSRLQSTEWCLAIGCSTTLSSRRGAPQN